MDIQSAIRTVIDGRNLDGAQMTGVMHSIMTGECTPSQVGGFLVGLRMKGETVEEIAAAATVMRRLATQVEVDRTHLVDTCGTGGDARGTFNISTASAFVAAGAGARVAKHGNRSVSGRSGSADVLEAAGVRLDLAPERIARCIDEAGVGFLFAPAHHGAMKHAIGPRREMAVRTIFNVLGPLTNPAGALRQVIGVFDRDLVEPLARVLGELGSEHVLVVHSEDGLDELSVGAPTHVAELRAGAVRSFTLLRERAGIPACCGGFNHRRFSVLESGRDPIGARRQSGSRRGRDDPQRGGGDLRERYRVEPRGRYRPRTRQHRVRRGNERPGPAGGDQQ